jgi:hypothetical protein
MQSFSEKLVRFVRNGALILTFAAMVTTGYAQLANGVVTGVVQDSSGAAVPEAEVILTSTTQGTKTVVKTNGAGIYRFDGVNVGDYTVVVTSTGFSKAQASATVVTGATVGRDFKLTVGSTTDVVEVSSQGFELQTEDAVRGGTIPAQQLAELPIVGQNSLNLILTVPGAVRSNMGGSLDSGIGAINGARARSNNFLLDGILNNDISVAGPQYTLTNNDELAEINFQTSNFSPEFGRAGGAVVSQITKSGTNQFHGTLAEVYRSQIFNASTQTQRNAYASALATYQTAVITNPNYPVPVLKNKFHENIPAFTIGGPVILPHLYNGRDRTFFFGGGQWDRYSANSLTTFSNVPTAAAYTTLKALAATGKCANVTNYLNLLQAAGNPVGSSTGVGVSTLSIAVPTALASTTCDGSPTGRAGQTLQVGQFYRTAKDVQLDNNHLIRIDHHASDKQNMMFRWLYDDTTQVLGGNIGLGPQFDVPYTGRTMAAAFSDSYQIKNNLVNEFRFGYTRANFQFNPASNAIGATLPATSVTTLAVPSISSSFPQGRVSNSYEFENSLTWVRGRHAYKGGVEFMRQIAVQVAPFNGRGTIAYNNITAAQGFNRTAIAAAANFIDDYAGVSAAPVNILFGSGRYRPNLFAWSFYLQDTYKPTSDLTLTYGFRYENFGQPANYFKNPAFVGYGTNDYLATDKVNHDNNNFGPSLGFAYNPHIDLPLLNGRTVIRGGYQVSYDSFYNNLLSNMAGASPNAQANLATASTASTAALPRGTFGISTALASATPTLNPYTTQSSVFSKNIRNPYYHHISFGIQEQLPGNMVLDMAYVGSLGRQLFFTNPINPGLPGTGAAATQSTAYGTQTLRVYANRGNIQIRDSGLTSNYNAFQVQLRHNGLSTPAGRVFLSTSYAFSKSMDVLTETFASNSSGQNPSRSVLLGGPYGYLDYGPSDNDRRHVSSTVINWSIRGPQQAFLSRILGGWSVAPILTVQSGTPYTVLNGTDRDFDGSSLGDRADIGNKRAPFDSRALISTTCASGLSDGATGNCTTRDAVKFVQVTAYNTNQTQGRNSNYTTRYLNLDTNVLKKIAITERWKAELRGEFFNITNNQNFDTPSTFKDITVYGGTTNFLNTTLQTGGSRTFRVGGKLIF